MEIFMFLAVISCFIAQTTCALSVTVPSPGVITTLTNREIILDCIVTGVSNPTVYWSDPTHIIHEQSPDGGSFGSGHSRFSYDFRPSDNRYSLRISSVKAVDDGTFRCIVFPSTDQPENGAARYIVRVVVKPPPPSIVGIYPVETERKKDGQVTDVVNVPHGQAEAKIQCVVGPSKPAFSTINWYMDGEALTDTGDVTVSSVEVTTGSDNLDTATSTVTITQPRRRHNGHVFNCMAPIPDAVDGTLQDETPVNQSFKLSVYFPPSQPVIEGYNGETKQPDDTVILKCAAIGGNPLPSLRWYRNNEPYHHEFKTIEQTSQVFSELTLSIARSDNGAVYRCDASSLAISQPYSKSVTLNVKFPPEKVTITGGENAKAGDIITLSCTTSNSHPRAMITWHAKGDVLQIADGATTVVDSPEGGQITQTNISLTLSRSDNGVEYTCQANNPEISPAAIESIKLNIQYPPDTLNITGFDSSVPVLVEHTARLTCSSYDGNPLPYLKWYNGTNEIAEPAARGLKTQGKIRSRELIIVAEARDNGAQLSCRADGTDKQATRSLIVQYPPQDVVITPSDAELISGDEIVLSCSSGSSNPVSTITWFKNNTEVRENVRETGRSAVAFGGTETRSSYTFTPTATDNGLVVHCSARNDIIKRSTTSGITLNVLHPPVFPDVPATITLQEGTNASGNFTVISNPPPTEYKWFKILGGVENELRFEVKRDGSLPTISVTDGILTLTHLTRDKAGSYRVKAINSQGTVPYDFIIDVQYGAGIPSTPTQQYIDSESALELKCVVDANPPVTADQAKWVRLDYSKGDQRLEDEGGNLRAVIIKIPDVDHSDLGSFTCEAENEFGSTSKAYDVTPVPFAPEIDRQPAYAKAAAQTHDNGTIKCFLTAYPIPAVTWMKDNSLIDLNLDKYKETSQSEGPVKFQFSLIVIGVGENDYGIYKCTATNDKGTSDHHIELTGTGKPEPPTDIEVLNVTYSSVVLSWLPGFDGGLEQWYRVRYHAPSSGDSNYLYVDARVVPFTVAGLLPETEYELTVQGLNSLGESGYQKTSISALTGVAPTAATWPQTHNEPWFMVIMALAVIGGLLLIVTTVLICIFIRRRRRKKTSEGTDSASQSNTVEMYGTHDGNFNDDAKSYSTFEQHLDQDFARHYEDDEVVKNPKETCHTDTPSPSINSPRSDPPWSKHEDPQGTFGAYKKLPSNGSSRTDEEIYANEIRNISKHTLLQEPGYQRPHFVAGRPPPPPIPETNPYMYQQMHDRTPTIPDRNYSPYGYHNPPGDLYYRSTPSVASTTIEQAGDLV